MPVYVKGVIPLLEVHVIKPETHIALADDVSGAGELLELQHWWDNIVSCGPKLGYNPSASKSWLVVKPQAEEKAREIFGGTSTSNITAEGREYLGGFIGSESRCRGTG